MCLSVCLSVKSHLTSRMSNRSINEHAYLLAYERQKICGDLPETTQPCPKRCLLMLLARVGARTDSTTRATTTRGVANFRARVFAYAYYVQYVPRVCTLVLFILSRCFALTMFIIIIKEVALYMVHDRCPL